MLEGQVRRVLVGAVRGGVGARVVAAVVVVVTVVVPTGKNEPDAGLAETTPQVPVVVAPGKVTTAPHWFGSLFTVTFAGAVTVHVAQTPFPAGGAAPRPETLKL